MRRFVTIAATALVLGLVPQSADAGWVTVKNETEQAVLYCEFSTGPLGLGLLPRRGKSVRVLPGESYKVFQQKPGERVIEITDTKDPKPGCPAVPLLKCPITWGAADITYVVRRTADPVKKTETWVLAELKPPLPGTPGAPSFVQVAGGAATTPAPAPAAPVSGPPKPE